MIKLLPNNLPKALLVPRIFLKKCPTTSNFFVSGDGIPTPFHVGRKRKFSSQDSDKYIVNSPLGEIKIPEILFHEAVCSNFSAWERKTAIMCGRTGTKYTFRNLREYSKTLAAWLQNKMNFSKGDVIIAVLSNCPEYPIILLAASQIGVIISPLNPAHTPYELTHYITAVRGKAIITCMDSYETCIVATKEMKTIFPIFLVRTKGIELPQGTIDIVDIFRNSTSSTIKPVDIHPADTLVIPFSSGTTGNPKGVVLSHRNLVSNLTQLSHPETMILVASTWFRRATVLGVLPMFHIFGMMVATFFSLKEGARVIILPSFMPREFVENMYRKKVSIIYAVPPLITFLTNKAIKPKYMKYVNYIVNGSAPYSVKDVYVILEKSEHIKIAQGYGMTETSPVLTHTSSKRMQKLVSIGVPVASTKLKVVSTETGEVLPSKKNGELCAFGPQVMKQYYNNPQESQNAFDQNGWFKTGDLAYYDEEGDFYIVERMKELIKVLGYQVAPTELEETLKLHPKIKDAVVVGIPHDRFGEVPKAYVIVKKKGDMTEDEVQKFMSEKHTRYKQLRGGVVFVDDFPRTSTGKIIRSEMKKRS